MTDVKEIALEEFQKSPELFFEKVLGVDTLEEYQRRLLQKIAEYDRVATRACHDVGKSWTLARAVLWFGACFPYSKIITTAPTYNQVKNILWSEIRAAYSRAKYPLGGRMNLTEWQVTKEGDWFAIGFTPRNELTGGGGQGTQSSFQGFHAPHILLVFDEATGIPANIWTMAEGIMTSGNVKWVSIGNPTSRSSEFFRCFSSPEWHKVSLNCFDSPNLIANGITDLESLTKEIDVIRGLNDDEAEARKKTYKTPKPHLLSLKWVISMAHPRKWGLEHPLFVSKVLGDFPKDADGTLLPLGWIEESFMRLAVTDTGQRKTLGVDVARFGTDSTVLTGLGGKKQNHLSTLIQKDTTEVVGAVVALNREEQYDMIVVDETGIGGGVVDGLNEAKREGHIGPTTEIRGVQFGGAVECDGPATCKHTDCLKSKYVNLKARMFGLLRDDLRDDNGLCLLNEDVYLDELPTVLYAFDSKGRMVIESKDEYKRRTGRKSPDYADSLALANFGRYDELTVGTFVPQNDSEYGRPFAAGLRGGRQW